MAFVPGQSFHADRSGHNTMRLNFSNVPPERIEEGMALGRAIKRRSGDGGHCNVGDARQPVRSTSSRQRLVTEAAGAHRRNIVGRALWPHRAADWRGGQAMSVDLRERLRRALGPAGPAADVADGIDRGVHGPTDGSARLSRERDIHDLVAGVGRRGAAGRLLRGRARS